MKERERERKRERERDYLARKKIDHRFQHWMREDAGLIFLDVMREDSL
jgi:hypothetical protein